MPMIDEGRQVPLDVRITDHLLPDVGVNGLAVGVTVDCKVGAPLVDDAGIFADVGHQRKRSHRLRIALSSPFSDEVL